MPERPRRNLSLLERPGSTYAVLGGLLLVGVVLRVIVGRQDLFSDELATYWIVTDHGLRGVIDTVASTAEITPPLSFVLSWITAQISPSAFMVRLPAFIGGLATIPMVWALGRRTVGREAALLATALVTLSPFMILYSAEARGYGVLMALAVASTLALVKALDGEGRIWWAVYAICACLCMYTHYTSIFVVGTQALWALWRHPEHRKAVFLSTAAAGVLFAPWLPGLKGDMDSPTTQILSAFSPLSVEGTWRTLGHWSIGFPYDLPGASLSDLPGRIPMVMLLLSLVLGAVGLVQARRSTATGQEAPGTSRPHAPLVVLLMLATPVGTFLQSAVSTNVFSVRSLAASWPYLALTAAGLIMASTPRLRPAAVALAVIPFAVGAVTMLGPDFQRPDYHQLARFADDHDAAVVVSGAAFPPGPLTQLEVESSTPSAPVLRLFTPEQLDRPFAVGDPVPDPADQMRRAAEMADGGTIVVVYIELYGGEIAELLDVLPDTYQVTDTLADNGLYLFDVRALALESDGG